MTETVTRDRYAGMTPHTDGVHHAIARREVAAEPFNRQCRIDAAGGGGHLSSELVAFYAGGVQQRTVGSRQAIDAPADERFDAWR